jgi:hypothetical protein
MKTNWNFLKAGALLFALPLMATAAVSASQWVNDTAPIELGVETAELENSLGVARVHTVALSASGAFEGRVATANAEGGAGLAGLDVFFLRNGKVVQETKTADNGSFRVEGLAEGNYSFVASGENGYAAYGVRVVSETAGVENVMEAAAIGTGVATAKQILDSNAASVVTNEFATTNNSGDLVGANRVNLVGGSLVGSVKSLVGADVAGSQVFILSGDKQIAVTKTDANGSFEIADMAPGFYNFVATGPSGIAAVSFEAINVEASDVEIPVSFKPVTLQDFGYGNSLDVYTTTGSDIGCSSCNEIAYDSAPAYQEFAPVEYASESIASGGSCGAACGATGNFSNFSSGCCGGAAGGGGIGGRLFGGGGIGGGAGLGRLGRIALLGGAVVGIVAIADDNDAGESSPTE